MRVDDTGEPDRTVTPDRLLDSAEQAFLRAEFGAVRPLLRRFENEFGTPDADDTAVRYAVLRGALAARAGNWPEAVRWCPDTDDLGTAPTGVVHALAVTALRRLAEEARHTEAGTAALVIALWAYLLDEEDPGAFRGLLTGRRGTPVPDDLWEQARGHLARRVTDLLRGQDVRAGRDALAAWETAWEAERVDPGAVVPSDAEPDGLIPVSEAAWHLLDHDRRPALLDAYTARHPDAGSWTVDSPDHRACAAPLSLALAARGQDRVGAGEWGEALADFSRAARLGRTLDAADLAAVLRAGRNVGRGRNGQGYSSITRIHGLELAHRLLPQDGPPAAELAAELATELVRQGRKVLRSDPGQSRIRFARALAVSPDHEDAQSGLDELLRAALAQALDGAQPREKLHAHAVEDLLRRDPDCAPARKWLEEHYAAQAETAANDGHRSTTPAAVREMLQYADAADLYDEERVDRAVANLLARAPRSATAESTRAALEHIVDVLSTVVASTDVPRRHLMDRLDTELLRLAEHLEATAPPSDVIELFLRGQMRTGVSARFDQTVEAAYLRRAEAREKEGDVGGARRDRAYAERIGAGLPDQGLLFGPAPGRNRRRHDDSGQESLF
ncbi:hypothetical protein ACIQK9_23715 [Streptomyces hydrogenans]|uniref:hypothetical protein n=1 Tax=Streptomyces hydrogenans TaxID=1873719 RepID=UPI00381653C1